MGVGLEQLLEVVEEEERMWLKILEVDDQRQTQTLKLGRMLIPRCEVGDGVKVKVMGWRSGRNNKFCLFCPELMIHSREVNAPLINQNQEMFGMMDALKDMTKAAEIMTKAQESWHHNMGIVMQTMMNYAKMVGVGDSCLI